MGPPGGGGGGGVPPQNYPPIPENFFFKKSPNLVQNTYKIYFCNPKSILNMTRVSKCILKSFFITRIRFGVRKYDFCQNKFLKTVLYDPLGLLCGNLYNRG